MELLAATLPPTSMQPSLTTRIARLLTAARAASSIPTSVRANPPTAIVAPVVGFDCVAAAARLLSAVASALAAAPPLQPRVAEPPTAIRALPRSGPPDRSGPRLVARASGMIAAAKKVATAGLRERLSGMDRELLRFRGLPCRFNILSVLDATSTEATYQSLLGWVLDPLGTHGLGDQFLRSFLGALGLTARGRVFDHTRPLRATVLKEVSWECVGATERLESRASRPATRLRVDLVVVVEGDVLILELKVDSSEMCYGFEERTWNQAALYTEMWRRASRSWQRRGKTESTALGEAIRAGLKTKAGTDLVGSLPMDGRVFGGLLHRRGEGACRNSNRATGQREDENGVDVFHMNWFEIDGLLGEALSEWEMDPVVRRLLESWRSAILLGDRDGETVRDFQDLRFRAVHPDLSARFVFESLDRVDRLIASLRAQDRCCEVKLSSFTTARTPP